MIIVYAADIGSIKNKNFAWARLANDISQVDTDTSIHTLVNAIDFDLAQNNKVCLGFECPLFINLPSDPIMLTSARTGEGSRAWSAGAGSGSLTTGLAEVLWTLSELKHKSIYSIKITFSIDNLLRGNENPYSLVGAALLRSGITNDIEMLKQQCIVIRA